MDNRRANRIPATRKVSVGFVNPGMRFTADLVDVSSRGLLVRTTREIEPGTMGRLGVEMGLETIRIVATVKRRVPNVGIAFEFSHMGARDRELLNRLIHSFARKP